MAGVWVLIFLLVWLVFKPARSSPLTDPTAEPRPVVPRGDLAADEQSTIALFRKASPSVVYITSTSLRRIPFSLNAVEVPRGTGSGFIYDREGHIVTNLHVIREGSRWTVALSDQSQWPARFVGGEPDKDIAVLKIDAPPARLTPLTIGTSSDLQVGQKVFAIGNPFGLDHTLTTGVVSALGREITSLNGRPIRDVIQTDAAINPGNSGGPLLDSAGRLIGVNTQIASPSGASAGIGFAVPVDIVNRVVPQIIRHGRVIRPSLGIQPLPDHLAQRLRIDGVLIADAIKGRGAERAGLRGIVLSRDGRRIQQLGDVITKIDDHPIHNLYDLLDALEEHRVGDQVRVTYLRDEKKHEVLVPLQPIH